MVVRADRETVDAFKAALSAKCDAIMATVTELNSTYHEKINTEEGLRGARADRLTEWFDNWYTTFKTQTETELSEFEGAVEAATADILAAGGE
jgi:inorganic pyrophosphatase